jgi:tripartite-type tricarboxylate transporter receptor subunit TctC
MIGKLPTQQFCIWPRVRRAHRKGQAYPTQPVRIVVGYAAGGGLDIAARLIGQWLSERLGQPFIIENRPGAAANIATEAVVRSPPDGYTLLLVNAGNAINATLYENLKYNFLRDIAPVASILRVPYVMVVNPSLPVKTVPEFVAYAKANVGKVNAASGGAGGADHASAELFKMMTGVSMVHVPYRDAAPALTDLLGGQVQVFRQPSGNNRAYRAGRLRALAVTSSTRIASLPDLPTMSEFVPGYASSQWYGVGTPAGTPTDIIGKLNKEINGALADARMKARIADLGGTVLPGSPAEFGRLIADETENWGKVVRAADIKPE